MSTALIAVEVKRFEDAEAAFYGLTRRLVEPAVMNMTHGQVEAVIETDGREILRQLYQGYINLRGSGDVGPSVLGSDGVLRTHKDESHRVMETLFGRVEVNRMGYRMPGVPTLFPLDAELNLPDSLYSHGAQQRVARSAASTSYETTVAELAATTGASVPKRQAEETAVRAAADFDEFYALREEQAASSAAQTGAVLVVTQDSKGIVMRKEDLRPATRKAASTRQHKLSSRLSRGEKRNARRMANVAAVYTIVAQPRTPEDIVRELDAVESQPALPRPRPEQKRVWASLEKSIEELTESAFLEGFRRDPLREKKWCALVDGNKTQLAALHAAAARHHVDLSIVVDVIHVTEYLWKAARALHEETSQEGADWVRERLLLLLRGKSSSVAAGMRRSATRRGLCPEDRKPVDDCARYLLNNRPYLRYDVFLAEGFPIATGVIEGACRHLVKDRMDLTGARWSLAGAEAILRLRSLRSSGDFDEYWPFHELQDHIHNHLRHYPNGEVPRSTAPSPGRTQPNLRLVK